ncbi:MAG: hypothetical protein Q3971_01555 [Moraxella sp.]|nr:hypothetical protein [Moraxella sp.]
MIPVIACFRQYTLVYFILVVIIAMLMNLVQQNAHHLKSVASDDYEIVVFVGVLWLHMVAMVCQ